MNVAPFRTTILIVSILSLTLTGCTESSSTKDWNINNGELDLEETLRVTEGGNYYLGQIFDVAVDENGRIYVADGAASNVKVFSPDGTLRDTIGRKGEGPGEFRRAPTQITLARGDSMFVLDSYAGQVSIFAPDRTFARRVQLPRASGSVLDLFVPDERSGFVARYAGYPHPQRPSRGVLRRISPSGVPTDTLLRTPPLGRVVEERNNQVRWGGIPFAPDADVASGPEGDIHYGWGDSLSVTTYSVEGRERGVVQVPFDPVPVTDDGRERKMNGRKWTVSTETVRRRIPSTKPAFDYFLVDDEGRYWFARPTSHPDSTSWWLADPSSKRVRTTKLSKDVYLMTVRNGRAYGLAPTDAGAPALVRFRVHATE